MNEDNPGNSIFRVGKSAGEIPGGAFIFQSPDGVEMFRISDKGIDYNGESVNDAGRLHGLMIAFFTRALPPEVKALVEAAENLVAAVEGMSPTLDSSMALRRLAAAHRQTAAALAALEVKP